MLKIIITLYILITSAALIVLKLGTKGSSPIQYIDSKLHFQINPLVLLGIALYGISFLLYIYLISKYSLGYIIPLTAAFIYILVFFASFIIFNEVFTLVKITGIFFIILGLVLLNLKR
jgi:drug/metabolite transporter (DMT)-like permease